MKSINSFLNASDKMNSLEAHKIIGGQMVTISHSAEADEYGCVTTTTDSFADTNGDGQRQNHEALVITVMVNCPPCAT